jgi:hypothetical protein
VENPNDYYDQYMDFLKRPRITDESALESDNGEKVEMTYEEFLRQVSKSDSDKKDYWAKHPERLPGEKIIGQSILGN